MHLEKEESQPRRELPARLIAGQSPAEVGKSPPLWQGKPYHFHGGPPQREKKKDLNRFPAVHRRQGQIESWKPLAEVMGSSWVTNLFNEVFLIP